MNDFGQILKLALNVEMHAIKLNMLPENCPKSQESSVIFDVILKL